MSIFIDFLLLLLLYLEIESGFFYYILLHSYLWGGTLMEIRAVLDLVIRAIFDLEVYISLAMLLFYLIILLCSLQRCHSFYPYFKYFS